MNGQENWNDDMTINGIHLINRPDGFILSSPDVTIWYNKDGAVEIRVQSTATVSRYLGV